MPAAEAVIPIARGRHPLVERVLAPSAAEAIRLGAARGALPLPPHDLVYLQIRLLEDAAPAVAAAAADSLARVAIGSLVPMLRDPGCDPVLLDHFGRCERLTGEALAVVISHPSLPEATLLDLAATGSSETLALIVTNEVRLIANPEILPKLRANPNVTSHLRRRLQELERDFIGRDPIRFRPADPVVETPAPTEVPPSGSAEAESAALENEGQETPAFDPEQEAQIEEMLQKTDAYQRIMRMNVAERQLLAMKGSGEERAILIRDTARMVSLSVLKNPRLTDTEITMFASMRNVTEDIIRTIARSREWTKSYSVAHALVRNPRTPPGLSLQFLSRLGTRDLKICAGDKNIPELVRRNARNLFLARTQPAKKGQKKAH
jgi:cell division septation protein DedD